MSSSIYSNTLNYINNFYLERDSPIFFKENSFWVFPIILLYCPVVFGIQYAVKKSTNPNMFEQPLKFPLFCWNILLSVFSLIGSIKTIPYLINQIVDHGLIYSICSGDYSRDDIGIYAFIFCLSKIPELIDTLFIVLRNKPLITLHMFHHIATLVYCWISIYHVPLSAIWFSTMNYFVHTIMYFYYAITCYYKIKDTRIITVIQIVQMIIGTGICITTFGCNGVNKENNYMALAMYIIYAYLFSYFYYERYIVKNKIN
jgi:elongation of very long chain fatty acids protein 6